jgi:predicted RNase H-like HicB family nuclease
MPLTDDRRPTTKSLVSFPIGLEQGPDGATLVHALTLPGCAAAGLSQQEALDAFSEALSQWLNTLASLGEPVPAPDAELEIAVDEWIESGADVAAGESTVCFEADLAPLSAEEANQGLRRLGDLRGMLLARLRRTPDAELDRGAGEWTARRALEELARAQWWTLSRLGSSPLAEVPTRTLGRLDTAMALIVQQITALPPESRGRAIELEGEVWTPRKVMRRLLWLEWTLGRIALAALQHGGEA